MSKITRVEDMPIFQSFYELALGVQRQTQKFPSDFRWLRNQSLRSSESVCANMTEGFYTQYSTEYLQCLYRCRREGRETMMHLKYALDSGLLTEDVHSAMDSRYEEALRDLNMLIKSVEKKIKMHGKAKPAQADVVKEDFEEYCVNHQP